MYFSKKKKLYDYSKLEPELRLEKARSYLLWILARRDYSPEQIYKKLAERKLPRQEAEDILQRLEDEGLYNPQSYLQQRVRSLSKKNYGKMGIFQKLKEQRMDVKLSELENILMEENIDQELLRNQFLDKAFTRLVQQSEDGVSLENNDIKKLISKAVRRGYRAEDVWNYWRELQNSNT